MESLDNGSAVRRALTDTTTEIKTVRFWFVQLLLAGIVSTVASSTSVPTWVPESLEEEYPYISVVLGVLALALVVFIGNLMLAPFRQGDETRLQLYATPQEQTPTEKTILLLAQIVAGQRVESRPIVDFPAENTQLSGLFISRIHV